MEFLVAAAPAFLASLVEAVEALTIVLAVGVTRQWRSTLYGVAAALLVLSAIVAAFGTAIVLFVPLGGLRVVIGGLLLIFGLQWAGKAVLRAAGAKAKHDEDRIYAHQVDRLRDEMPVPATGLDGVSFALAFKGVLLEGLEVCFIVVTFGSSAGQLLPAAAGALLACVLIAVAGFFVRQPLSRVPENGLKYVVGMMLLTFGTFWSGEGIGIDWPAGDVTLIYLLVAYVVAGLIGIWAARRVLASRRAAPRLRAPAG